jgi:hypothetical protein
MAADKAAIGAAPEADAAAAPKSFTLVRAGRCKFVNAPTGFEAARTPARAPPRRTPPHAPPRRCRTQAECEQHTSASDCWLILHEKARPRLRSTSQAAPLPPLPRALFRASRGHVLLCRPSA